MKYAEHTNWPLATRRSLDARISTLALALRFRFGFRFRLSLVRWLVPFGALLKANNLSPEFARLIDMYASRHRQSNTRILYARLYAPLECLDSQALAVAVVDSSIRHLVVALGDLHSFDGRHIELDSLARSLAHSTLHWASYSVESDLACRCCWCRWCCDRSVESSAVNSRLVSVELWPRSLLTGMEEQLSSYTDRDSNSQEQQPSSCQPLRNPNTTNLTSSRELH